MYDFTKALKDNRILDLKRELNDTNPVDIAILMEDFDHENTLKCFRLLKKDLATEVFANLSSEKQEQLIEGITDQEISKILNYMYLDDTVDLIEEMPAGIVAKILRNTTSEQRKLINQFLKYPEDSAGSVMTVEYIAVRIDMSVEEALKKIRNSKYRNENVTVCFAIDKERKLKGVVPFNELIINSEDTIIEDIMDENIQAVGVNTDQEYVAHLFRKYDLSNMPVVDNEDRLVGVITVDDVVDVIDQENTEDFQKMAAMNPSDKEYLKESVFELAKHRILWLLVLMVSATATGTIIRKYEDTLQSVVVLAAFIPMLMDTGGNAGSQSSTLVIRGLALGEIKTADIWKILWKEFRVSLLVGVVLSGLNFLRIIFFDRKVEIKIVIVICLSLFFTVIIAKVVGGILPIAAKKIKCDPAIMASPLITTIVDACALIIYFSIATILLHIK